MQCERPVEFCHTACLLQLVEGADKGCTATQHHQPFCAGVKAMCCQERQSLIQGLESSKHSFI